LRCATRQGGVFTALLDGAKCPSEPDGHANNRVWLEGMGFRD